MVIYIEFNVPALYPSQCTTEFKLLFYGIVSNVSCPSQYILNLMMDSNQDSNLFGLMMWV